MLENILSQRKLPSLLSKDEMLDILLKEEYGYLPAKPEKLTFEETENFIPYFCAGKAISRKIVATATINGKDFSFPFHASIPKKEGKIPFFVLINFRDNVPDMYFPTEEIMDEGFAVLSFCYKDVTSDDGDFTNGLSGILYPDGKRNPTDAGKIAMWAWAAQRVMDYAQTLDCLDMNTSIVCGHSRLGKTALLTGATDERFKFVYSNDSGCSGAAITRDKVGETVKIITTVFPYWFCENYLKYVDNEHNMPFDQHYLVACSAPRYVYVASAIEDEWADPASEMLSCVAASDIYNSYEKKGFICENRLPLPGDEYHEGSIGYHVRSGIHYFSREDWQKVIKFVKKHS